MTANQIFPVSAEQETANLAQTIARNVRRLRARFGYTQDELAERGNIDPPSLGQIEAGEGQPSLALAWRVAHAFQVPLTELTAGQAPRGTVVVRYEKAPNFVSGGLGLSSRALLPFDEGRGFEVYELTLAPQWREACEPHIAGTYESLHVAKGLVGITVGREATHVLQKGDTITFPADLAHVYHNLGDKPAQLFLIMAYDTGARGKSGVGACASHA